jgi:uridine phosphorylase
MAPYLRPTAPTAPDALLPASPGAALALAQDLLGEPRMSNHSHGLWGYHGETASGRTLTVQSTGIGGPSAAIVLRELRDLGVERAVRIGDCTPLDSGLRPGEVIVVERALVGDGTSAALGARGSVSADAALTRRLVEATGPTARASAVASSDLFYDARPTSGAPVADLESAALLALGRALGLAVAAILVVGDPQVGGGAGAEHVAESPTDQVRLGRIASAALGAR